MNSIMKKIKIGGLTHNGTFHADDVLSTCLLRIIYPEFKYIRANDIPIGFDGIAYDVGGGRYDHHTDIKKRENGKNYASLGLLWKDVGTYFMDAEHARLFDDAFISEIDRCDTTPNTNLLSSSIEYFNPKWNSDRDTDTAFVQAVECFLPMIERLIQHFKCSTYIPRYIKTMEEDLIITLSNLSGNNGNGKDSIRFENSIDIWNDVSVKLIKDTGHDLFTNTFLSQVNKTYGKYKTSPFILGLSVMPRRKRIDMLVKIMKERIDSINALVPAKVECERVYANSDRKDILIFETYVPNTYLTESREDVKVMIFPSERGYNLLTLEKSEREVGDATNQTKRFYFPCELRGKDRDHLQCYHEGLLFVHQSGFLATCATLESALSFYEKVRTG